MHIDVTENTEKKRFEAVVDGIVVFIDYIKTKDKIYLTHTDVAPELEGKGIGTKLVHQVLEIIKSNSLEFIPLCPFVASYIKENPSYKVLLARGYSV